MASISTYTHSFFKFFYLPLIFFGYQIEVYVALISYDYGYTHMCLVKPLAPQYNGGIVINPELNQGLKGWGAFRDARVEHNESSDGNKFVVASNRQQPYHSFTQKLYLKKDVLYTFSAWLQVSHGNADIAAIFKTPLGKEIAGWVTAQSGCWSMLKGGLLVNASGPTDLYFESENTRVDIWADNISVQPFTRGEWEAHQNDTVHKLRKRRVKFQVLDKKGQPVSNVTVLIKQWSSKFPLGCAINPFILTNSAFDHWFTSRFNYTVFENQLKWFVNEKTRGVVDYSAADALTKFAEDRGVSIRGHNVHWDNPNLQPSWVPALSPDDLKMAMNERINSAVGRYRGKFIHWDGVNENMGFDFFESRLGADASSIIYKKINNVDGGVTPFLNEIGTIEDSADFAVSPVKYLQKISQIRWQGYKGPLGIGLEGHFNTPNLPYVRSALDTLASARLPIWITELDVGEGPNQAIYLDQILREFHAHPAVKGIMIWGPWTPQGCYRMCLTDNNFKNLATGDVVDNIIKEWSGFVDSTTTDSNGFYEALLHFGEYEVEVANLNRNRSSTITKLDVVPNDEKISSLLQFEIRI